MKPLILFMMLLGVGLATAEGLKSRAVESVEQNGQPSAILPHANVLTGQKLFAAKGCGGCHGDNGQGIQEDEYKPILASQPKEYLIKILSDYRDGHIEGTMSYYAKTLGDSDIANIAAWLSSQPKPKVNNPGLWQPPIVKGNRSRMLSPCESCHGLYGMGSQTTPALLGQKEQYLYEQLINFKKGKRPNDKYEGMTRIGNKLDVDEIRQLAAYFSGLTKPAK